MESLIFSLNFFEFVLRSCSSFSAIAVSSGIVPATLHQVTFFNAGLLSRYSLKWVSSSPSINQYRRFNPSRPQGWTESGWFRSSS